MAPNGGETCGGIVAQAGRGMLDGLVQSVNLDWDPGSLAEKGFVLALLVLLIVLVVLVLVLSLGALRSQRRVLEGFELLDEQGRRTGRLFPILDADEAERRRRRLRHSQAAFGVSLAAAVVILGYVWFVMPLTYRARSLVLVESPVGPLPMQVHEPLTSVEEMDRFINDQAGLLRDELVLREALQDNDVRGTNWFKRLSDPARTLPELQSGLDVRRVPESSHLVVSFATADADDAPRIVNTVIKKHLAKMQKRTTSGYIAKLDDSRRQEQRILQELESLRQRRRDFMLKEMAVPGLTMGVNVVGQQYAALADALAQVEIEKTRQQVIYDRVRQREEDHRSHPPRVPATQEAERDAEAGVNAARAEDAYVDSIATGGRLQEMMLEAEAKQRDLEQAMIQYQALEEAQQSLEEQAREIRAFNSQLFMLMGGRDTVRVQQIGQAQVPVTPDRTPKLVATIAALLLPLVTGLWLVFRMSQTPRKPTPATA